jgi:hypothetical protein
MEALAVAVQVELSASLIGCELIFTQSAPLVILMGVFTVPPAIPDSAETELEATASAA